MSKKHEANFMQRSASNAINVDDVHGLLQHCPKSKKNNFEKKEGKYYKKLDEMKFRGCSYILMAFANGQDCIQRLECHRFKLEWGCYEILTRHYTDSLGCVLNLANKCPLLKKTCHKAEKEKKC